MNDLDTINRLNREAEQVQQNRIDAALLRAKDIAKAVRTAIADGNLYLAVLILSDFIGDEED